MNPNPIRALAAAAALAALAGCAAREAKWEAEAAQYAVYATQIPLYPGAKIEDALGSDSYGDEPDSHTEGMTWWFAVSDSKKKVARWYEARLAGARKEIDEEGNIMLTLAPKDGEAGEEIGVIVEEGKLRVFERTRAGKHGDA